MLLNKGKLDPSRVEAVKKIKSPTCLEEARKLHGYFSSMRRFIKKISTIAAPITDSLETTVAFTWGPAQGNALNILKTALMSAPPLKDFEPSG